MNETTPNEPSADDDGTAWDWERPMSPNFKSPNFKFSKEERDIVIKYMNIFADEYYVHGRDFRTLMDSDARPRFIKIREFGIRIEVKSVFSLTKWCCRFLDLT